MFCTYLPHILFPSNVQLGNKTNRENPIAIAMKVKVVLPKEMAIFNRTNY